MDKANIFNIVWVNKASRQRVNRHIVSKQNAASGDVQTINYTYDVNCMVLYPSLVVPEIVWDDEWIEIVLITQDYIASEDLNTHLKFSPGIDAEKKYYDCKISDKVSRDRVQITVQDCHLTDEFLNVTFPEGRFGGILQKETLESLLEYSQSIYPWKYDKLVYIKIGSEILNSFSDDDELVVLNVREAGKGQRGQEEQDLFIYEQLTKMNGKKISGKGRWCFDVDSNDVDFSKTKWDDPVQSYHPVFYYESFDSASFSVLADTHISSRQKILKRSNARVIEYPDASQTNPEIGANVNVCSTNTKFLLDDAGQDDNVNVVLIAGDLIDFIMNAYSKSYKEANSMMNAKEVWKYVKCTDKSSGTNYQDFVDLVSFYSMVVNFYRTYGKPIYVVSGNHDCYYQAFGISPRLPAIGRPNAGIPADHNLTFYESILAFGESYGTLLKKNGMPFDSEKFLWFFTVLSPFHDFAIKWTNQTLIGFGWGNVEDAMIDTIEGQGLAHLGRAEEPITDNQLALMERSIDSNKKTILLSHFTFASFSNNLRSSAHPAGYLSFEDNFGTWDSGTFETNRNAIFSAHLLTSKDIQFTISGHSHRRGIYTIENSGTNPTRLRTCLYDVDDYPNLGSRQEPIMIVSDSSGSIPRNNIYGEFSIPGGDTGWGSSPAAGLKILTNSNASIDRVTPTIAGSKPRIVVALEYLDIEEGQRIITRFSRNRQTGKPYTFRVDLNSAVPNSIAIDTIVLYSYVQNRNDGIASGNDWFRIELREGSSDNFWVIDRNDEQKFEYIWENIPDSRGNFISIKFKTNSCFFREQYNFDDAWEREFQVVENDRFLMSIEMDPDKAEIPDFEWRHSNFGEKY